jgi:hypothetical protein
MPIWDVCECSDCQYAKRGLLTPTEVAKMATNKPRRQAGDLNIGEKFKWLGEVYTIVGWDEKEDRCLVRRGDETTDSNFNPYAFVSEVTDE